VLSATCFRIVLLASGHARAGAPRLLEGVLPLGVVEASHFVGSIAGAGLLLRARASSASTHPGRSPSSCFPWAWSRRC
jgi:lysylphosphatidylglycerol synthetase-like protein (DUF2156 family)